MKRSTKSHLMNSPFALMVLSFIVMGLMGMLSITQAQNSSWTQKADMPTARLGLATAVVDGKIYAIGGYPYANGAGMTTNEVYDPNTNKWEGRAPMPTGRRWMSASSVK
ncbi:MAG: kelch repeat-containing protein, partial [Bacteroidales bacterium]